MNLRLSSCVLISSISKGPHERYSILKSLTVLFRYPMTSSEVASPSTMAVSTIAVTLLFGTNAILFILFQAVKYAHGLSLRSLADTSSDDHGKKNKEVKELSKPFTGTLDCFTNATTELFRTGLIMLLTYVCERHWLFDHSGKTYNRDLFMFVILVFFIYGFYTIKPVHDLSLLSREQTEEWKGWMQFIFLLYHYFHAEEVYNSVRVMITCYVWMTGYGNFSFFYIKQDFGWLRVVQMMWRLNFSVLLLMWTHANTWILYYICPMHTFYFLMVYATMYLYSSVNHSKWGIRVKLMIVGLLVYIIWDINGGLFDIVFAWLGTTPVVGANNGSVWEYYFRTSLDHWSSFLGMIFALNYPLAEQYYLRAKGWPLVITSVLMAGVSVWWFVNIYSLEKFTYNLSHSYYAIIPLIAYIFFRNITPSTRSYVSMSMHDLGKTTLETYLLQHHIWLTSNAKTLLTIVPDHPWINFALATVLFFLVSKELYRLTMSLRGMFLPDDKSIAWKSILGMTAVMAVVFLLGWILHLFNASLLEITLAALGLAAAVILIINRFARQTADHPGFQAVANRATLIIVALFGVGLIAQLSMSAFSPPVESTTTGGIVDFYQPPASADCLGRISNGHWVISKCPEPPAPALNKMAYCESDSWAWDGSSVDCPIAKITNTRAKPIFSGKRIVFVGDSMVRNVYHEFNKIIDPKYKPVINATIKHINLTKKFPAAGNATVSFIWAPFTQNATDYLRAASATVRPFDCLVLGLAAWDALYTRSVDSYVSNLNTISSFMSTEPGVVNVWLQPTSIVDAKLPTTEKQAYLTEKTMSTYRSTFQNSVLFQKMHAVLDPTTVSKGRETNSMDGIHYGEEVYAVIAQMVANAYSLHFPKLLKPKVTPKFGAPKPTGSMSFPIAGAAVLVVSAIMLFSFDSFFGKDISCIEDGVCHDVVALTLTSILILIHMTSRIWFHCVAFVRSIV